MEKSIITTKIKQADEWIMSTTLQNGPLVTMLHSIQVDLQRHLDEEEKMSTTLVQQTQAAITRLEQKINEIKGSGTII